MDVSPGNNYYCNKRHDVVQKKGIIKLVGGRMTLQCVNENLRQIGTESNSWSLD